MDDAPNTNVEPETAEIVPAPPTELGHEEPARPQLRQWVYGHLEHKTGEQPVLTFKIQGRSRSTETWKTLVEIRRTQAETAREVYERVELEAGNQSSRQLQVLAFRARGRIPISCYPIITDVYSDDFDDDDDENLSKGRAASEIVKQTLRHNEALVQCVMRMCGAQTNAMAKLVERYERREELSDKRHLEAIDALHNLQAADRQGAAEEQKWKAITNSAQELTTAISYKLTSGHGNPEAKSKIMSAALRRLGESLTDEQAERIGTSLRPEQAALLRSLLEDPDHLVEAVKERDAQRKREAADAETK